MTPERISEVFGDLVLAVSDAYGLATVDVAPARWVEALTAARGGLGCGFFDWLTAVDELDDGFAVVAHVCAPPGGPRLLVRTRIPRAEPVLASVTGVYAGAAWHERETHEMFGIRFAGHPGLDPLLLPDGFEGNPLRKDFVLVARVAKAWPGAKEPGEADAGSDGPRAPGRRRLLPPGVPDPADWGPEAAGRRTPAGTPEPPEAGAPTGPDTPGEPGKPGKPGESPTRPRRMRSASEGSASQRTGTADTSGTAGATGASGGSAPRRSRSASEGSASQRTGTADTSGTAGTTGTSGGPAPKRTRSASDGPASRPTGTERTEDDRTTGPGPGREDGT